MKLPPRPWVEGYVLDYHTVSSTPTGDPYYRFDTRRTELGELLFRLKYRAGGSVVTCTIEIGSSKPFAFLSGRKYAISMTLEDVKQAIAELPEEERTSLVAWLNERDAKAWDKQIEDDFSEGGAGMAMLEKWDAEIKTGKSIPLEEFLAQREKAHKAE